MWRTLAVVAASAGLLAVGARANGQGDDGIPWQHDLDAAQAAAASQGRPLLVVFRCER